MKKIKWGIFGTGSIAKTFAEALGGIGSEKYAIASRSEEKARTFGERYGFTKSYGSYEQLAADPETDIIYIATPMSSHYDDTMLCLRRGKSVLCEKSAAVNYGELDDMLTLAREKRLFFMEAMWMKCRPSYIRAKQWALSGRIGKIKEVRGDFSNIVPFDKESRLFRADLGGGALLDLGVYPISLAADILGNYPCEIKSSAYFGETGVDLTNAVLMKYPGNSYAAVSSSFCSAAGNAASVTGTKGFIIFDGGFVWSTSVSLYDTNGELLERFTYENEVNGYEYEIKEAESCLERGLTESPLIPHSSTEGVMKIMDACREQWEEERCRQ